MIPFYTLLAGTTIPALDAVSSVFWALSFHGENSDKMTKYLFRAFNVKLPDGILSSILDDWAEEGNLNSEVSS